MKKAAAPVAAGDPWIGLKRFTTARIALGRTGMSQPTEAHLAFQLAHARARDAVNLPLDLEALEKTIVQNGMATVRLASAAADRPTFLRRPDLGRQLDAPSRKRLGELSQTISPPDIALVICDGLSSSAIKAHAAPFTKMLIQALAERAYEASPVCLVAQGRVAVGDPIGAILSANVAVCTSLGLLPTI